jgi:hypothetical protein
MATRGNKPGHIIKSVATAGQRQQIIDLLQSGITNNNVARKVGVSVGIVAGIAAKARRKGSLPAVQPPSAATPLPPDTPDWAIRIIEAARSAPATTLFKRCDALHAAMDAILGATMRRPGHSFGA